MQGLWFAITNDHLSSDSRARIYPELLGDSETSFPLPLASLRTPAPRTVPHILDLPLLVSIQAPVLGAKQVWPPAIA